MCSATSGITSPSFEKKRSCRTRARPFDMKHIDQEVARALFLRGQGLHRTRNRRPTRAALRKTVEELGFIQVDAIQVLERAHHLILRSRFRGYQPKNLTRLLEEDHSLFEHWTHDASLIPVDLFPQWTFRFDQRRSDSTRSISKRFGGARRFAKLVEEVRERIRLEGPLATSDFDAPPDHPKGTFWNWKPAKAALEHGWRVGEFGIAGRDQFKKRYDLFERVHPDDCAHPRMQQEEYLDWALPAALERLGTATPRELGAFWGDTPATTATAWCKKALTDGRLIEARVDLPGDKHHMGVALPDLDRRIGKLRPAPGELRLLCPFDPLLRDRDRARRLFDFDYRFEGFVPAAKRRDGYYVLAVLDGDRLIARFDPRLDRKASCLEVRRLRWERGARTSAARAALQELLKELAADLGAARLRVSKDG